MDAVALTDATWPPAETVRRDGWVLRRGAGGGQRASAATHTAQGADPDVAAAAMRAWGQRPLFRLEPDEADLDAALAGRGYALHDPCVILAAAVDALGADDGPDPAAIRCSAHLAVMAEIWARDGIGPGRLAVMDRVAGPKVWLMVRHLDRPAGCAFVAVQGAAMLHALTVVPGARRQGLGARLTRAAAAWAKGQGADSLALAVTAANGPARGLYARLGFGEAARYHYRRAP